MDCSICNKPVELNQKFVSDFGPKPERKYFISHAQCAAISDPKKIKTMTPLRVESLALYQKLMAQVSQPSVTGDQTQG